MFWGKLSKVNKGERANAFAVGKEPTERLTSVPEKKSGSGLWRALLEVQIKSQKNKLLKSNGLEKRAKGAARSFSDDLPGYWTAQPELKTSPLGAGT